MTTPHLVSISLRIVPVLGLALLLSACVSPVAAWRAPELEAPGADSADTDEEASDESEKTVDATVTGDSSDSGAEPEEPLTEAQGNLPDLAANESDGAVSERVREERQTAFNPYVITAHKENYILPFSYTSGINESVYQQNEILLREGLQPIEVKFQISLKTQLNERNLLFANDALSLGITIESWWQLYSDDLSSPFRETNYQPEMFYLVPLLWGPFGGSTAVTVGLEHQSNGQVQGLSRSWNRIYTSVAYEKGNFVLSVRPWYRIPEDPKETPNAAEGDDNPDILDFMGHGEISTSWRDEKYEYRLNVRGNPSTGKGSAELSMTYPLFGRFRGYVQAFSGYGESLIDYDFNQQRIGLGVALTNLF